MNSDDDGPEVIVTEPPRTRLEQVLRQRHLTVEEFRRRYQRVAGTALSERQAYRWVAGELRSLPYQHAQSALERLFGEPAARLLGTPYGHAATLSARRHDHPVPRRGDGRSDWEGQVIALSADRARDFLTRAEATNVGTEALDQLADDVRRLVNAYPRQPLQDLLGDLVDVQGRAFGLLEGRQKPDQTRDLYLLAGVASGLMAKASHDLGAPHDAMTQARAAHVCADNAGHDGLRAWTRGLQALIAYWSGQFAESVRYAEKGADAAARSRGTAGVWLASGQARALAAMGRADHARAAVENAADIREQAEGDELDEMGGLCTFSRPRGLYYAAEALAWAADAERAERLALEALDAYATSPDDRAFGDEAGTRCALAVARLARGEVDGAAEALAPVLLMPVAQRIHGVVMAVDNVVTALRGVGDGRPAAELADALQTFGSERLVLPR
ncbi:hypothetical protein ABTZ99_09415 [Actinosynnema sp. NPDC002837]